MVSVTVIKVSNRLPTLPGKLQKGARALVQETATEVRDGAKARSRVDTGEMRDSWVSAMVGDTEAEVTNATPQAVFNEWGTVHMSASPMAHPAADAARPGFIAGAKALIGDL